MIMAMTKKRKLEAKPSPAENITNDATRVITDSMIGVGEAYAQGDLYFIRLAGLPKSVKARSNRQLADGTTQGSRHVCTNGNVFDPDPVEMASLILSLCKIEIDPRYIGPVIQTVDDVAHIEHPEHGDHDYRGEMVLGCVFQRALDAEEMEARVQD